jgi:uncharacterized protein (DUF1778 family)
MGTISLRLDDRDHELIKRYAAINKVSMSKLLRDAAIEKIEDELDTALFDKALEEIKRTYTLEEVKQELGL